MARREALRAVDVAARDPWPMAVLVAVHAPPGGPRTRRSWPLHAFPIRIVVGRDASSDWVFGGDDVQPWHCMLRWDGRRLVARLREQQLVREVAMPIGSRLQVGSIELMLGPAGSETVTRAARLPRGGTDVVDPMAATLLPPAETAPSRLRSRASSIGRAARVLARLALVLPLVSASSSDPPARARASIVEPPRAPSPAPAPMIAAPEDPFARESLAGPAASPLAPPRAARLSPDCGARPLAAATPADYAALHLAMEAYRLGRRDEARVQLQTLTCRPDVGALAQYLLARLGSSRLRSPVDPANTALWLPQGDRAWRTERLFEEAAREIREHADEWGQSRALDHMVLANPALRTPTYDRLPKCNIFVGELLYRAGFVPPGTSVDDRAVAFPSVNEMVAAVERLERGLPWRASDGAQWLDVVPRGAARPGDLLLIDAAHRGDIDTEHGHVEIIRRVVYRGGALVALATVGARTRGAQASKTAGAMFLRRGRDGRLRLSRFALVARPRLR